MPEIVWIYMDLSLERTKSRILYFFIFLLRKIFEMFVYDLDCQYGALAALIIHLLIIKTLAWKMEFVILICRQWLSWSITVFKSIVRPHHSIVRPHSSFTCISMMHLTVSLEIIYQYKFPIKEVKLFTLSYPYQKTKIIVWYITLTMILY